MFSVSIIITLRNGLLFASQKYLCCCFVYPLFNVFPWLCVYIRDVLGNVEVIQLDFEMENFTSLSVTRRINWNIDYKGQGPSADSEKVVTELTVVQRDIQAILPLAMVSAVGKEDGMGWAGFSCGGVVGFMQIYESQIDCFCLVCLLVLAPGLLKRSMDYPLRVTMRHDTFSR